MIHPVPAVPAACPIDAEHQGLTVVTNNSTAAVTAYLTRQHPDPHVGKIIGRDDPDPAR
jgi:hypothetical protein